MLVQTVLSILAGSLSLVQAAPTKRAGPQRVIGYHESWYYYDNGNTPFPIPTSIGSKYTHINYAFATIAYHPKTDQFYVGFTDSNADYQDCVGTSCPTECIPLPSTAKTCAAGKVAMVPYIGAAGACPDTTCHNPSSAPGAPRVPKCESVLNFNNAGVSDANGNPVMCGNYAYVLNKVKKTNPNLKFLISIGGWYDSNLFSAATEDKYIDKFVTSIVKFVQFFGFDGVDFDWEYPGWEHGSEPPFPGGAAGAGTSENTVDCSKTTCAYAGRTNDKAKFTNMVNKVRAAFTAAGKTPSGSNYLISMAAPAGDDKMNKLDIAAICKALDYINIMTYDIHGDWETNTNHQAALYDDTPPQYQNTNGVPMTSVDYAVSYWINNGCPANQVVIGLPFYAHGWSGVADGGSNGLFQKGTGITPNPDSAFNYGKLKADSTIKEFWDVAAQASYGYSASTQKFYTYDN
ncbi:hypothetical protein HDU99_001216, partial [Rhizoclosmatium hyalinum]